jgi:hypothetical protein
MALMARLGIIATALFGIVALMAPVFLNTDFGAPASVLSLVAAVACYELIYQQSQR